MIDVDTNARLLRAAGREFPCRIGREGAVAAENKREGDWKTPLGTYRVQSLLLRPDRVEVPPGLSLPWRWLATQDGWSDDPADPAYNQPVTHPHGHSAERLWRGDGLYDIIVIIDHNDPPVPGLGSAVFLHCTAEKPYTAGCVAVDRAAWLEILPRLSPGESVRIR